MTFFQNIVVVCAIGILVVGGKPVCGQSSPAQLVDGIWETYQQLEYERAEAEAREALAAYERFSADQLADIHTVLALVNFSQNEPQEARQQFKAALDLTPELTLDPLLVSPKIVAFFEKVKQDWAASQRADASQEAAAMRYVRVADPRPAAALRSMILPGWGQLYKGERTKGRLLLGAWGLTVSGGLTAHVLRARAEDRYLDEENPDRIEDRFETFNTWHKVRNNLLLGAAVVWAFSYVDALIRGGPGPREKLEENGLVLVPAPAPHYVHAGLRVRF